MDWHVSKAKGNIWRAVLFKHRVHLIEDLKLSIWQKIEVSPMLGLMHRTIGLRLICRHNFKNNRPQFWQE